MPQQESRVKKSLLNARVNLIFYFLTLALSFFSRKIFLDCLGADFIGLTGTLYNLLGFLNLAELGIGSAIGYVLYKPIFDHDQQRINEIISVMGYLYRWIGLIILSAGCILACFLPLIYPNTGFDLPLIYFAYFSFLASSLIGYFINYRQNLLGADQKSYVVTAYFQTGNIIKTLIQMALAYYTGNYYFWVAIELAFGIIYSFILNWKINQTYPWLKADIRQGRLLFKKYPEVMRYTRQLFVQQINGIVQFQTTPFLTYAFVSLKMVTYYGNYTLIIDKVVSLMSTVLNSTSAGVGNLIAEGDRKRTESVFWELTTIRFWIGGLLFCSFYLQMDSFISLWIGKEYVMSRVLLVLIISKIYLQIITGYLGTFLYGYGLFADIWASYTQTIIYLLCAIVGGYLWGLSGIIGAGIVSIFIIVALWKPYYLYRKGFQLSLSHYWMLFLKLNGINGLSMVLTFYLIRQIGIDYPTNWGMWIAVSVIVFVVYTIISGIPYLSFNKYSRIVLRRFYR